MVKYFLSTDKDHVWHGQIIDDSEGTIGQSRQITRFRQNVDSAIVQFITKQEKFLFGSRESEMADMRAAKFRKELNKILSKNHFKISKLSLRIDPEMLTALGIDFEFESTEA